MTIQAKLLCAAAVTGFAAFIAAAPAHALTAQECSAKYQAAKKDGTLVTGECYLAYEAGAFPGSPVGMAMAGPFAPYDIPNVSLSRAPIDTPVRKPLS